LSPHRPVPARRAALAVPLALTTALALALALAAGCTGGPPRPAAVASAPAGLRDAVTVKAADTLCAAENHQEMGTSRLGQLYNAKVSGYLAVQRLESQARRDLRTAMGRLSVKDSDRPALGALLADQDGVLKARDQLFAVLERQPAGARLALLTGPQPVVDAYLAVVRAYLDAGRHFLAAGLPDCATPLITVLLGPGTDEASAATVEFRIAAACPTVSYTTEGTPGTATAPLGSVVQPGTHKPGDRYDGSAGPVVPPVRDTETVVLTSIHYPVQAASCVPAGPSSSPSTS
jgi:hypothetical protein